ncbi:P-loop containing nucleoside triphosphate hydrolase protein [Vararia minispora EC-137]|uniref:P-loop containing nucleoside triphosphate hydrolase protein n=1 Tax=Vararia minispora EC-137 TaxID=1314806 RepID=A0ACB8QNS4_9AGAM|nr:P-loop containing nucleoside triphosphate hydrolase protein [Vararia minispora EC-137]
MRTIPAYAEASKRKKPDDPIHDEEWIKETHASTKAKDSLLGNPKSAVANWLTKFEMGKADYVVEQVVIRGQNGWRARLNIQSNPAVMGIGDAIQKKDAERLASLHALYELASSGLLDKEVAKPPKPAKRVEATIVKLPDGEEITYDRARQFMDYYCRRYNFSKPDIVYAESPPRRGVSGWEAVMYVGGRRIGIGVGGTKKEAQTNCYIDVTQYLESCDPELWRTFTVDASKGKDLGLAPRVFMDMDDRLEDEIREITVDIRKSTLWQNRPISKAPVVDPTSAKAIPRYRPPIPAQHLSDKSKRLRERRQAYLSNPSLAKMRETRASLPVFTRADDILKHVRENDVTVCMAATGSGKTTQIPQIILDEFIDRDEGAKCNIVCTQPRRIAAISVAQRVAAERGENVGRGSIGYQVRFEAALPEDHGSVTFCTTGVFLRRMQSALQDSGPVRGMNLDDVTHIIVDEAHERDVDTDLLLVVLKRLLADRKAKGKPLKVILMSATIDPTLFQRYFLDEQGQPSGVIEVPGRSFPVQKHFMDDFVPALSQDPAYRKVFDELSVSRYVAQELPHLNTQVPSAEGDATPLRDDDLEFPASLVALTIAHVMQKSEDGHVLVFLPGWEEIQSVQRALQDRTWGSNIDFNDPHSISIHLLHSSIPVAEQQIIFDPPPAGVRRVILSTNIAETSVTIPDVVYVVDSAKIREVRYDPQRHMSSLVASWVGSSNLNQRAGRAGRHRPGEYFGILSQKRASQLATHQVVEMQRTDLTNVVMHIKALDFPGMAVEDVLAACIEPPEALRIVAAMEDLRVVGALDEQQHLTSLGRVLLQLPIEVQVGRMLLFGCFFRCVDKAVSLASILTNRDPFLAPMLLKAKAQAVKDSWSPSDYRSDILATLRAFNTWSEMQTRGRYMEANRFASDNFLSKPTLLQMLDVKRHLLHSLYQAGILDISAAGRAQVSSRGKEIFIPPELNQNGDSYPLLVALIASASQPKFAIRTSAHSYRTQKDKMVMIHPSSVNHRKREGTLTPESGSNTAVVEKQIIAFQEKRKNVSVLGSGTNTPPTFLMGTTRLDPMTYVLFGAYQINVTNQGLECDDWLPVVGNVFALDDLSRLKNMIEACMLRVFEGLLMRRVRQPRTFAPVAPRDEQESGDEEDDARNGRPPTPLSEKEVQELDYLTKDVVLVLNRFGDDFVRTQSRANSRPGTPSGSPSMGGSSRLPPRSGASTPWGQGSRSAYNSRPGTPSGLKNYW